MSNADKHFQETLGAVPAAVSVLAQHAPGALDGYLSLREYVYREPPDGHLDASSRELLFVVLDVVEGHFDGAKAHAEAAIKAGLSVEALTQGLVIAMMVSGIHTWSMFGADVVSHAAAFAERENSEGE